MRRGDGCARPRCLAFLPDAPAFQFLGGPALAVLTKSRCRAEQVTDRAGGRPRVDRRGIAYAAEQLRAQMRVVAVEYSKDQGVLLLRWQVPYPRGELRGGWVATVVACAVVGRDGEKVLVEADEVHQAAQRRVQDGQIRWDGWFDLVVVDLAGSDRVQPGQVQQAEVARGEVSAGQAL